MVASSSFHVSQKNLPPRMNVDTKKCLMLALSSIVKVLLIAGLILGLGWGLVQVAIWKTQKPTIKAADDGSLVLSASDATLKGIGGAKVNQFAGKRNIGWWDSTGQWLEWKTDISQAGIYRVELEFSLPGKLTTNFDLICGDQILSFKANGTGGWDKWDTMKSGEINLVAGDGQMITLKATRMSRNEAVLNFVQLRLIPVGDIKAP